MKIRRILSLAAALILALSAVSCNSETTTQDPDGTGAGNTQNDPSVSTPSDTTDDPSSQIHVKLFKVGKANATLIRTPNSAVLIDDGENDDEDGNGKYDDGEKILEYLAEKSVTKIDYLIVTQFNKNHYGSTPTILEEVTVENIIEPDTTKTGTAYDAYRAAVEASGITPTVVSEITEIECDGVKYTIYPAEEDAVVADQDEYYSLAVSVEYGDFSLLLASDVFGARTESLIASLAGKTFDVLQVPMHGAYNDTVESLITATDPDYAVIFASYNNPEDERVTNILTEKGITFYVTKDGSVEVKYENGVLNVKQ